MRCVSSCHYRVIYGHWVSQQLRWPKEHHVRTQSITYTFLLHIISYCCRIRSALSGVGVIFQSGPTRLICRLVGADINWLSDCCLLLPFLSIFIHMIGYDFDSVKKKKKKELVDLSYREGHYLILSRLVRSSL